MADTTRKLLTQALEHPTAYIRARAQIILSTLEDKPLEEIVRLADVTPATVIKWQGEWAKKGMAIFPDDVRNAALQQATPEVPIPSPDTTPPADTEEIIPQDTLPEAIRKILRTRLAEMHEHQAIAVVGEDIEGVHQMRVRIRQMSSLYDLLGKQVPSAYRKKSFRMPMQKTAKMLGTVRDLDVLLENIGANPELVTLHDALSKEQQRAHKALRKWLKRKEYIGFSKDFARRLEKSVKPHGETIATLAPRFVLEHLQIIYAYEAKLAKNPEIELLHALRIEFKRLRYLLEFFAPIMGEQGEKIIKICKKIQDHLGALNDTDVAIRIVNKWVKHLPVESQAAAREYIAQRQAEQDNLVAKFPKQWAKFLEEAQPLRAS